MKAKKINFTGRQIQGYTILKLIGQGHWSDVYLAQSLQIKQRYAIKVTSFDTFHQSPKLQELLKSQINILQQCNNPNVIKLYKYFIFQQHQFMLLEYCNGVQLGDEIQRQGRIQQPRAISYLKQILNGFKGLHQVKAMHRDFKVQNIMLHDNICKILDLGFGKQLIDQEQMASTKLGSYFTMAPQVMDNRLYDFKADIWSIGIVYYQLLYGQYPFKATTTFGLLQQAKTNQIKFNDKNNDISELSKDFIKKCLTFDPQQRISWIQIYKHQLIEDKNLQYYEGLPQKHINVEENISFYEELQSKINGSSLISSFKDKKQLQKMRDFKKQSSSYVISREQNIQKEKEINYALDRQKFKNMNVKQQSIENQHKPHHPYAQNKIQIHQIIEQSQISPIKQKRNLNKPQFSIQNNLHYKNQTQKRKQLMQYDNKQYFINKRQGNNIFNIINTTKRIYRQYLTDNIYITRQFIKFQPFIQSQSLKKKHRYYLCLLLKEVYLKLNKIVESLNRCFNFFNLDQYYFSAFIFEERIEVIRYYKEYIKDIKSSFYRYLPQIMIKQVYNGQYYILRQLQNMQVHTQRNQFYQQRQKCLQKHIIQLNNQAKEQKGKKIGATYNKFCFILDKFLKFHRMKDYNPVFIMKGADKVYRKQIMQYKYHINNFQPVPKYQNNFRQNYSNQQHNHQFPQHHPLYSQPRYQYLNPIYPNNLHQ